MTTEVLWEKRLEMEADGRDTHIVGTIGIRGLPERGQSDTIEVFAFTCPTSWLDFIASAIAGRLAR